MSRIASMGRVASAARPFIVAASEPCRTPHDPPSLRASPAAAPPLFSCTIIPASSATLPQLSVFAPLMVLNARRL